MYEQDMKPVQVAHELRVSKSAYQWRRRGGLPARRRWPLKARARRYAACLAAQLARLRAALDQGSADQGGARISGGR